MSRQTFTVMPPREPMTDVELRDYQRWSKCVRCWLCGFSSASLSRYADHMQRHRDANWIPKPPARSKTTMADLLAGGDLIQVAESNSSLSDRLQTIIDWAKQNT